MAKETKTANIYVRKDRKYITFEEHVLIFGKDQNWGPFTVNREGEGKEETVWDD